MKKKTSLMLIMLMVISTVSICGCGKLPTENVTQTATASSYEIDVEAVELEYYNDLFDEDYTSYSTAIAEETKQYECNNDKEALYKLCILLNGSLYDEEYQTRIIVYYDIFFDT
ncbi:MAG: hypothetical protein AAGU75_24775, partial [Bacillota bacterium]